jgi:hypothetical protein
MNPDSMSATVWDKYNEKQEAEEYSGDICVHCHSNPDFCLCSDEDMEE